MGLIKLLWVGKVPLVISYWVFIVFAGLLLKMANVALTGISSPSQVMVWLMVWFYSFQVVYLIFITISVWRAAGAYVGKPIYANLAKLVVGLSLFFALPQVVLAAIEFVTVLASYS